MNIKAHTYPTRERQMQNRDRIIEHLNTAFAQKYHSMAQYVLGANPYVKPGDDVILREIRAIAQFDREEAERLAEAIENLNGIPQIGMYSPGVADLNYLELRHLLGVLVEIMETQLAQYESFLAEAQDLPPARQAFEYLAQATRQQVQKLKSC